MVLSTTRMETRTASIRDAGASKTSKDCASVHQVCALSIPYLRGTVFNYHQNYKTSQLEAEYFVCVDIHSALSSQWPCTRSLRPT